MTEEARIPWGEIDKPIRPLVSILTQKGLTTIGSCQGGEGHAFQHPTVIVHATPETIRQVADRALSVLVTSGYTGFQIEQVQGYQGSRDPWGEVCFVRVVLWDPAP